MSEIVTNRNRASQPKMGLKAVWKWDMRSQRARALILDMPKSVPSETLRNHSGRKFDPLSWGSCFQKVSQCMNSLYNPVWVQQAEPRKVLEPGFVPNI